MFFSTKLINKIEDSESRSGSCKGPKSTGQRMNNSRIESQSSQNALFVRQEGLLLHIIRHCFVHRVMQFMCRRSSSSWAGNRGRAVYGSEAGAGGFHMLIFLSGELPERIFVSCPSLRCASKQEKIFQPPLFWSLATIESSSSSRWNQWTLCS